ncbi:hypothetical protein AC1031_015588 [Aphanomyces cochlioides]|nr:hypothetical protein AC1031_015588 [Aphanomyces cochlioides]
MKCVFVLSLLAAVVAADSNSGCGNLVPCKLPNGTLVECQNPNHRQCCQGVPYWVYITSGGKTVYQFCCKDANGTPLIAQGGCPTSRPKTTNPKPSPTPACGNLIPCNLPNGTLVECQNPNHRQCCHGLPYSTYIKDGGKDVYQSCCQDPNGKPFIVAGPSCPSHKQF